MTTVRKLIEVALPLREINEAAAREKSIRHGHPSTLHLWWARRPLAAARAVLFAQLVDDPSSRPELFPTEVDQARERERLFAILRELVKWENTTNEAVLDLAREEIRKSWWRTCADNADHPRAAELFDPERLPAFHDPFAGGGAIPLEAQRLGLEAHASDLNPVAVLINKAMIEIPPKFAGRPPVNPESRKGRLGARKWKGAAGLAEDVRYYGQWMRDEAEKRIGHLYPKVRITPEMVATRPDLERYAGRELTVIAWLWARTVRSPNPAFAEVEVPLVSNFLLSTKKGREAYVEPVVEGRGYRFDVRVGPPPDTKVAKTGTKISRGNFRCIKSGAPIPYAYIDDEANVGRMGARLMAVVAQGDRQRVYLPAQPEMDTVARSATPAWRPDLPCRGTWASNAQGRRYGFHTFGDYFTERQLTALTTFSDLVGEVRDRVHDDAISVEGRKAKTDEDNRPLREGGVGPTAYADAVSVFLAFALSKLSDVGNSLTTWGPTVQCPLHLFSRQAIPMVWDFAEGNPLSTSGGSWIVFVRGIAQPVAQVLAPLASSSAGRSVCLGATQQTLSQEKIVSTDPPYYDNIGYGDLSDFFYVWLRRALEAVFPELFTTLAVPKADELVATPYRHGSREDAEAFFLNGMKVAMQRVSRQARIEYPVSIYYAFKQSETKSNAGTVSTGWETFLDAVIGSGLSITGTWPMRTERSSRLVGIDTNALASSIVLVCRRRPADAPPASWGELRKALQSALPPAVVELQKAGVAPVDLAQAAIGPGMAVFTRYAGVFDQDGEKVTVGQALALINEILDRTLVEQEGEFDADTRWALAWFTEHHFDESEYGIAEMLSKAKNTSVEGLVEAGILRSRGGRVRLLRPEELPEDWNPVTDRRLTVWEMVHHLVRVLEGEGEGPAGQLLRRIGGRAETARALAHLLYALCDRQKRSAEARLYNSLVISWPELARIAREDHGRRQRLQ